MHFEIPNLKRCCLCVPLRHGILIFGYMNLLLNLLIMFVEGWFGYSFPTNTMKMYHSLGKYAQFTRIWLPHVLYSLEIIFNVILLIGAHIKQTRLIRVFYYYGITTTLAFCLYFVVIVFDNEFNDFYYFHLELSLVFISFVLQVYLLLLVRAELQKLENQQGLAYVNHMVVLVEPPIFGDGQNPHDESP